MARTVVVSEAAAALTALGDIPVADRFRRDHF
jgi:hypothetical protein